MSKSKRNIIQSTYDIEEFSGKEYKDFSSNKKLIGYNTKEFGIDLENSLLCIYYHRRLFI